MADNTRLPQPASNGDLVATDEITGGVANGAKVQRVKLGFGADGAYADVEGSDPLPVTGAVTVSGVATAAAQATAQTALDAIKVATESSATATGQTTGNATLAAIKTAVEGTIDVAGTVAVASLPSVTIGTLPDVTIGAALPAGANALGSVTVTSAPTTAVTIATLPALAAGTASIGAVMSRDATPTGQAWTTDAAVTVTRTAAGTLIVPVAAGQHIRSLSITNPTNSVALFYFVYHGAAPTWSGAALVPANLIACGQMGANNMVNVLQDNAGGIYVPNGATVVVSTANGSTSNLNYGVPTSNIFATVRYGV